MSSSNTPRRPVQPMKTLARLLPAPASLLDDSRPRVPDTTALSKRPRIGVPIACNYCRVKKTRCDGGKPSCTSCLRKGQECAYENPNIKAGKNGDLLVEAIGLLITLPPSRIAATIISLGDQQDSTAIIDAIRQAADHAALGPEHGAALYGSTLSFSHELTARHPFTYPYAQGVEHANAAKLLKELLSSARSKRPNRHEADGSGPRENSADGWDEEDLLPPPPEGPSIDPELEGLNIERWTTVPVSNEFAATAISMYFATDHPLLSPFHRGRFLQDLVEARPNSTDCSPAMVNALLYWCCQMYTSVHVEAVLNTEGFRVEAQKLLSRELESPQATTMVAAMFLSLGHLAHGKDHAVMRHLSQAAEIGVKLGLFGVDEAQARETRERLTASEAEALAYPCWGVFNWIVLMTLFYRQQGVASLAYPPVLDVPASSGTSKADADHMELESLLGGQLPSYSYAGDTFVALCHFWRIMYDVATVYYCGHDKTPEQPLTLQFAEFKFRELLAWTDELPLTLARSEEVPHYILILHLWLHSAILDIFRPFLQGTAPHKRRLRTFAPPNNTPDAAYEASVEQLKQLIVIYRSGYSSSHYTIVWQTSLLYTANAMLHSADEDRLTYFLICLYSYEGMRQSFRVTEAIVRALLSMGMQNGVITGPLARRVLQDLQLRAPKDRDSDGETIRAPFIADLDQAVLAPDSATVEAHAAQFDENAMLRDYTSLFDLE